MKIGKDGWLELDPAVDMSIAQRAAYEEYKEAYRMAAELRKAYEAAMQASAPEGMAYVFGYNFGKASVKEVRANEVKASKPAKRQMTLAEYNAARQAEGR